MGYGILAYSNTLVSPVHENNFHCTGLARAQGEYSGGDREGGPGKSRGGRGEVEERLRGGRGEVEGRSRGGRRGHGMHILKYLVDLVGVRK